MLMSQKTKDSQMQLQIMLPHKIKNKYEILFGLIISKLCTSFAVK